MLDTNVISEPWKPVPKTAVLSWLGARAVETLFLSSISSAELRFGTASISSAAILPSACRSRSFRFSSQDAERFNTVLLEGAKRNREEIELPFEK